MKEIKTDKLIYTKIPLIMGKIGFVGKDKKNQMQGYNFRSIDDMYNALNKHLSDEQITITSEVLTKEREERKTKSGGALIYTILTMKFVFYATDGSSISSTTVGEAMDSGDKSANKAMSTAYKYALMQVFCIPTEELKDSDSDSYKDLEPKEVKKDPQASTLKNIGIKWQSYNEEMRELFTVYVKEKYKTELKNVPEVEQKLLYSMMDKESFKPMMEEWLDNNANNS